MSRPLSPNTAKAVELLFSVDTREEAIQLLTEQCAENLPNCEYEDEYELEDLRFQVLKLSGGDIEKLRQAVHQANVDWRELSVAGNVRRYKRQLLGPHYERNLPSDRVMYGRYINLLTAIVVFLLFFILRLMNASILVFGGVVLVVVGAFMFMMYLFVSLRKDLHFRKHDGAGGIAAMMFLGTFMYIGIPAVLGVIAGDVIQSII